jgi:4-hydroxy-tetrahydrodipicolinate reductase
MAYRVIQWATGQLGQAAIAGMVGRSDMELVGGWVHSAEKDGRDLGELAGLAPIGVTATRDKDALLAMPADCVCYMPARNWTRDPTSTLEEIVRILRAGKNVANAAWPALLNPKGVRADVYDTLQEACLAGGSSFYTSGIDPGFGNLNLALAALGVASGVTSVHTYEIGNYASYANPDIVRLLGFGQPDIDKCALLAPGYVTGIFASTVRLIGEAIGLEVESTVEDRSVILAEADFDVAAGPIRKGTISGMRFSVTGLVGGERRIVVEHVTRLRDEDYPEIGFPGHGYRVEVDGEPCVRLDMDLTSHKGDAVHASFVATAMAVVNAIPQVCAAPPGVLTALDLKQQAARKLEPGRRPAV